MSDETEDTGRIVAFRNQAHEAGSKQPAFKGTISTEDSAELHPLALWVRISKKTGRTFMTGRAGETAAAQIDKLAAAAPAEDDVEQSQDDAIERVRPFELALFKNDRKEPGSRQPDYFGYFNPGDGASLQRLDVWARNDKYGKPMLSGNVSSHKAEQKNEIAAEQTSPVRPKKKRALKM